MDKEILKICSVCKAYEHPKGSNRWHKYKDSIIEKYDLTHGTRSKECFKSFFEDWMVKRMETKKSYQDLPDKCYVENGN